MTRNKRRLVSHLLRFIAAAEVADERAAEAFAFDRAFDGGEFCGPAIGRQRDDEIDAAARRLGFADAFVAHRIVIAIVANSVYRDAALHLVYRDVVAPIPN